MGLNLGDAGASNDDASYGGVIPGTSSAISADYYREKYLEFQKVLNGVDASYQALAQAVALELTDESRAEIESLMNEYDSKRWTLKATAETLSAGAALVNSWGGRLPALSIPQTLGLGPIAMPFAVIAAIATAATLITWGYFFSQRAAEYLKRAQLIEAVAPEQRAALVESMAAGDQALAVAQASGLGTLAPAIKWIAFAALAWVGYQAAKPLLAGLKDNPTDDLSDDMDD